MGHNKVRNLLGKIDRLFAETLKGGKDDHAPWDAVSSLHRIGNRAIFDRAVAWSTALEPLKRARAAAVLAQLRHAPRGRKRHPQETQFLYRKESFDVVSEMLDKERDTYALIAEISALGHIGNSAAIPIIAKFADHANEDVRFSVAWALGSYHDDPLSISVLQKLMEDVDRDVRDWAIFGLGVLGNADNEEIRLRFLRRLDDPFPDAKFEAAAALGKRQDARLAKPLVEMLKRYGDIISLREAARDLLKMTDDPSDWSETEYIVALQRKFLSTLN